MNHFSLTFDQPYSTPVQTTGSVLHVSHAQADLWCLGEVLSYTDAAGSNILQAILKDIVDNKLQADKLNGRFVLMIWLPREQVWQIITDRFGMQHCYWHRQNEQVHTISTDLTMLAKSLPQKSLNPDALASFFTLGFFLDTQTHYREIEIMRPATIYRISANGQLLSHTKYWSLTHNVDHSLTYDDAIDQYHALLTQAVRRATDHTRFMLPLSGGLDSRSIAAVLPPGNATISYGYGYSPDSSEQWIASRIAAAKRFQFTAMTIQPYLFDRIEAITAALHGCQDINTARQISATHWLHQNGASVISGLWGDVWCDQMGLADGLQGFASVAHYALKKFDKGQQHWLNDLNFLPDASTRNAALFAQIESGLNQFEHIADLDFRLKAYKTSQWAFRWSNASLRGFELGAMPRVPYYDIDLSEFFSTLPTSYVRNRRIQIDHLKRYAPELARIRWDRAEANLYYQRWGYWLSLPRRSVSKIRRALRGQKTIYRNWEIQLLPPEVRPHLEEWLLPSERKIRQYITRPTVDNLLKDMDAGDVKAGGMVSMLLTLSVWLEITA